MLEFQLQFYFEKYKNTSIVNRELFRQVFKRNHGEFRFIEELIIMIEKYQIKTYGETLSNGKRMFYSTKEEKDSARRSQYHEKKKRGIR